MAKKKTSKKPGRPPGSTNRDYHPDAVVVVPVHCPKHGCLSTDVEQVRGGHIGTFDGGRLVDGRTYTRRIKRRMYCRSCRGYFVADFLENDRPAEEEKKE